MRRANTTREKTFYLTPHGVQEFIGLEDLEAEDGSIEIECEDGRVLRLERVVF